MRVCGVLNICKMIFIGKHYMGWSNNFETQRREHLKGVPALYENEMLFGKKMFAKKTGTIYNLLAKRTGRIFIFIEIIYNIVAFNKNDKNIHE